MDTLEQQMGYVIARLEDLSKDSKAMGEKLEKLETRVDDKFKTAETALTMVKWLGGGVFAILTLPWASIKQFVVSLFR